MIGLPENSPGQLIIPQNYSSLTYWQSFPLQYRQLTPCVYRLLNCPSFLPHECLSTSECRTSRLYQTTYSRRNPVLISLSSFFSAHHAVPLPAVGFVNSLLFSSFTCHEPLQAFLSSYMQRSAKMFCVTTLTGTGTQSLCEAT